MEFSKIYYQKLNGPIASVDRFTKELFIDADRWAQLQPGHKEFILLHENGHIVLDTSDEIAVNKYAINQYIKLGELSIDELGYRISVLSDLLETEGRNFFNPSRDNFDPVTSVANAASSIFSALPALGIGSKSRLKEQQQAIQGTMLIEQEKAKIITRSLIIGGSLLIIILLVYLILKK